jgi:hypothetical protein
VYSEMTQQKKRLARTPAMAPSAAAAQQKSKKHGN